MNKKFTDMKLNESPSYHQASSGEFKAFLEQCKRAINKIHGCKVPVKYDFWSSYANPMWMGADRDDKTYWDVLKETGSLVVQDGYYCIDFTFGIHVFAGWSTQYDIDNGYYTYEEYLEWVKTL